MRFATAHAACRNCQEVHTITGTPGHKVTAEFTCPCGQRMVITVDFTGVK